MHLFFSQTKCAGLQTLHDYCKCELGFPKEKDIKNEIQGLISNLKVTKRVLDECSIYANITQDELQCVFVFADAQKFRKQTKVQFINTTVPLRTLFVEQS